MHNSNMNPRQLNDIKLLTITYVGHKGYKTKNIKFKAPQNRDRIVSLIDSIKSYSSVFNVTGYTLEGSYI